MAVQNGRGMLCCIDSNIVLPTYRTMYDAFLTAHPQFLVSVFIEDRAEARAQAATALTNTTIDQTFHDLIVACIGDDPSGGGD